MQDLRVTWSSRSATFALSTITMECPIPQATLLENKKTLDHFVFG